MCALQCDSLVHDFVLRYFGVLLAHQYPDAEVLGLQTAVAVEVARDAELVAPNAVAVLVAPVVQLAAADEFVLLNAAVALPAPVAVPEHVLGGHGPRSH